MGVHHFHSSHWHSEMVWSIVVQMGMFTPVVTRLYLVCFSHLTRESETRMCTAGVGFTIIH